MLIDIDSYERKKQYFILYGIVIGFILSTYASIEILYIKNLTSPIWFASGFAFAAIILFGKRVLPYAALGSLISTALTYPNNSSIFQTVLIASISALGLYLQILVGYKLIKYFNSEIDFLKDVRSSFIFAIIALIIGALNAVIGVGVRVAFTVFDYSSIMAVGLRWWLGDVIGLLIFTSLILSFVKNPKINKSIPRLFEVLSLFSLIFIFTQVIFGDWIQNEMSNSLPFLLVPVLLWIAFRFSTRETALAMLVVTIVATYFTRNDLGPFARDDIAVSLLLLQLYLGAISIMAMVLAVSVQERKQAQKEYENISDSLERRVSKRTDELATLNKELLVEVNQRKKAEAELKESQERNTALLHSLPDIIFLHDGEGKFIDYQAPDINLLYMEPKDFIGKPIESVLPVEIANDMKAVFKKVFKTGQTLSYEYVLDHNHEKNYFEARVSLCGENRFMSVIRDMSDKKRAEDEKVHLEEQVRHAQKLESLGVLAGGIAHDFNNLLTSIMGNTGLAMMNISGKSRATKNLNNIEKASLRAADLCRQLLAYSGKGKFVVEAIKIDELIKEMSKLLEVSISKKAKISYNFQAELPAFEADATQIRQIVMNLITNASEAIGDNIGKIEIETGVINCDKEFLSSLYLDDDLEPGEYVFFDVADTGDGMTEETKTKLFDPFYTTKFTGRGLGLAAVIGIVRGHKGTIKINSNKGEGTRFRILFPVSERNNIPAIPIKDDLSLWKGTGTVLVVDDDESIRMLGKATLEHAGIKVITANDGMEAVDVFKKYADEINLILMDMTMPRLNGDEAFNQIHQHRPDVKVILSSGYSEQDATQKFSRSALGGFLQKPYKPEDLIVKVKDILAEKQ